MIMENDNAPTKATEATEETEGVQGTFVSRFVWTFVSPRKMFADVEAGVHWLQPLVWVSLINMVTAKISVPIQIQIARLNPGNAPQEQVDQSIEMMEKFWFLGIVTTPVVILFTGLIILGISYLVLSSLSERAKFGRHFCLYLYASIMISVGTLLSTLLTRMRGVETIRVVEDAYSNFGPSVLFPAANKILTPILSTFDVFYVWFYILVGMGVVQIFKLSGRMAALVVVPIWLLYVLLAVVSARFASTG